MTVTETTVFRIPRDRELQFPALAITQAYVNTYQKKCKANDASNGTATYELIYAVQMDPIDWQRFIAAGLVLEQQPVAVDKCVSGDMDMLVDMSDDRLLAFHALGKHAVEICGHLCGTQLLVPFPRLRMVKPKLEAPFVWAETSLGGRYGGGIWEWDDLVALKEDHALTGVIGIPSPATYLAAAMGLAVVEIIEDDRPRNWLSKWGSSGYRVVTGPRETHDRQIRRAVLSLERNAAFLRKQEAQV